MDMQGKADGRQIIIWLVLLLTAVFTILAAFAVNRFEAPAACSFALLVEGRETIKPWLSEDGACYVFLPSCSDLSNTAVASVDGNGILRLGGQEYKKGDTLSGLALGKQYEMEIGGRAASRGPVTFLRSENVSTLYVNTATGSMERIYEDKSYKESARIALYTEDGALDYAGTDASIKGRGNSTWMQEKKPFLLTLGKEASLLGMAESKKYVLLANAFDETNLRNRTVYDFAARLDLEWTPATAYVDLYLNGEYNGLYLMAEKVEISDRKLNVEDSEHAFLCKIDLYERWEGLNQPFLTEAGRCIEIACPADAEKDMLEEIRMKVQSMENAILAEDGIDPLSGRSYEVVLDLDSWAAMYLIDEFFENVSGDNSSSYFYGLYDADYGIRRGPVWDYDLTAGSSGRYGNDNPLTFCLKNRVYYSALLKKEAFRERVIQMYYGEFVPLIDELLTEGIRKNADKLERASQMNSIRWEPMFLSLRSWAIQTAVTAEDVAGFLQKRADFMSRTLNDLDQYNEIMITTGNRTSYFTVEKDGSCNALPVFNRLDDDAVVYRILDGISEEYDLSTPVTEDIILAVRREKAQPQTEQTIRQKLAAHKRAIMYAAVLGVFALAFSTLGYVEMRRGRGEKR